MINGQGLHSIGKQSLETLAYLWLAGVDHLFPRRCMGCHRCLPREDSNTALSLTPHEVFASFGDVSPGALLQKQFNRLFAPFFCPECMEGGLLPLAPPRCRSCADPLPPGTPSGALCHTCAGALPVIGRVRAVGAYGQGLLNAIHLLKYNGKIALARPLGQLLFLAFCEHFEDHVIDKIVPIPLHRSRLVGRGFNQAFVLVQHFKRQWRQRYGGEPSWQVDYRLLKRCRKTASQTGFSRHERRKNLENAFRVTAPNRVKAKAVLLVDDVYTTGSTCLEAAGALRRAGAATVDVLVLARA